MCFQFTFYIFILLSSGDVPDLSLPSCTVAHKDSSAKNALWCSINCSEDSFDAILMKTLSLVLQTCTALGILTLLNEHTVKNVQTEKEFAFRTLKEFYVRRKTMQVHSTSISKCHPSQPEYLFLWKSPPLVAQNGTLSVISCINTSWNTCLSGEQQRQPA